MLGAVLALAAIVLVVVSNPRTSGSTCGRRAQVATLSDIGRHEVDFVPVPTGIQRLRHLRQPSGDTPDRRAIPVETTTYEIPVRLVALKRLSNHDIRLAVSAPRQPSQTINVTFPDGHCGRRARPRRRVEMKRARSALITACGKATRKPAQMAGSAQITGVGSFGRRAGPYSAPNGIELSPVLHFKSFGCRRWP